MPRTAKQPETSGELLAIEISRPVKQPETCSDEGEDLGSFATFFCSVM